MNAIRHLAWSAVPRAFRFPIAVVEAAPPTDVGTAISICPGNADAEAAVWALARGGFDMSKLSIVAADHHSVANVARHPSTSDRIQASGRNGESWAGMWGLCSGFAIFAEPGFGPIVAAGPLVAAIVSQLEGTAVVDRASTLCAGLAGLGIPRDRVTACDLHVKAGRYVIVAHGTRADVGRASDVLTRAGIAAPELHPPSVA